MFALLAGRTVHGLLKVAKQGRVGDVGLGFREVLLLFLILGASPFLAGLLGLGRLAVVEGSEVQLKN